MRFRGWMVMAMLAMMSGCGDRPVASTTAPATPAAVKQAASEPAATQAASSFMKINNRLVVFPAARLKLETDGTHLTALLFSDDPPAAIKDDYDGNSYYLQMKLDVEDPKELGSATWTFKAPSSEREDSPYGIYLNGKKIQLQPMEVGARFAGEDPQRMTVSMAGQFQMLVAGDNGVPQMVLVAAELPVKVEMGKTLGH